MKKLLLVLILTVFNPIRADAGVDITDPNHIAALNQIQNNLDSVSTAMMGCLNAGVKHPVCLCKFKNLIICHTFRVECYSDAQ